MGFSPERMGNVHQFVDDVFRREWARVVDGCAACVEDHANQRATAAAVFVGHLKRADPFSSDQLRNCQKLPPGAEYRRQLERWDVSPPGGNGTAHAQLASGTFMDL